MNSDRDNTAEVISKAIQSQLAAMLRTMIHETLAKKNLERTACLELTNFEHQFKFSSPVNRRVNKRLK